MQLKISSVMALIKISNAACVDVSFDLIISVVCLMLLNTPVPVHKRDPKSISHEIAFL